MSQTHVQTPAQTHVQTSAQTPVQNPAQPPVQAALPQSRVPVPARSLAPAAAAVLRGRIGTGFSPEPHRYRLYVAADDCPSCLGVTAAFADLGLRDTVALTVLRPGSDPAGHDALRRAYEAAGHDHDGTLTVPALCDGWSGRVVSNHAPDILEDLRRLSVHPAFRPAP
ncbi:hypothetical protein [Streptomyces sp. NBC_00347]|uniref:hypothetical protein n=1 Tax=Streptomyces sp. NBC_00347 TaxID=2975721 RepID=UPI00224DE38F|nr:hypothetical protein [Streptomyces sp. NBC_00347]MCX5129117.1 hypothetical protein [Streptomyces sp. NBC_00347]